MNLFDHARHDWVLQSCSAIFRQVIVLENQNPGSVARNESQIKASPASARIRRVTEIQPVSISVIE